MTANVKVEIAKRSDALRVPNAALRFRPSTDVFAALNQQVPPEALNTGGRGGRGGGQGRGGNRADAPAAAPSTGAGSAPVAAPAAAAAPASSVPATTPAPAAAATAPDMGFRGGRGGQGGGGGRGFDPARMMERFKGMSPDEQTQFIARMKDRGQDTSAFEKELPAKGKSKPGAKGSSKTVVASAQTIDALFAPLPVVESRGRVWLFMNHELKAANVRLGITDGTNTELIGGELQLNMEVVTSVTGLSSTRAQPGAGAGNPLMPAGGRGPGGPGGAPGGRGR